MNSRSRMIEAKEITSERVLAFRRYWEELRGDRKVPLRAGVDPIDIPRLLPYIALTEIEREPLRVRYRLVGTRLVESNGFDFTGRYMDECGFAVEPLLQRCYQRLVTSGAPVFAYYEWLKPDMPGSVGKVGASQTGFFPLSSDGNMVDRAVGIADFEVVPFDPIRG